MVPASEPGEVSDGQECEHLTGRQKLYSRRTWLGDCMGKHSSPHNGVGASERAQETITHDVRV